MKRTNLSALLLIVFFSFISCNYTGSKKSAPNWIRAHFKNDPATTVVIGWHRNNSKAQDDRIYYDTVDHGDDVVAYANELVPDKYTKYFGIRSAFVELTNLEPDTKYYFLVVNTHGVSERYYVQTLPDRNDVRLSIVSGGDSRNNRVPRRAGNELVRKLKPHFVLFGGDMTDFGIGNQWGDWFEDWELTHGDDGRVTPIVMARGNHERNNGVLESLFWAHKDNYYVLGIADDLLRVYTLNSEMSTGGNQLDWLKNDLASNQHYKWKFAQYHKPMRPHTKKKPEGSSEYQNWANVFYDYKVNLVMESDSHLVKATWPIRPSVEEGNDEGFVRDDENGTVYIGEGCWGAPLKLDDDIKSWTRDSGSFNQFKWIFLDYNKIEIRTVMIDNASDVGNVDMDNRFEIPKNLELWDPSEGEVVVLE